jgi:putative MATE family efflux protein
LKKETKHPPDHASRIQIMESMPIGKAIWKLSIPTMIAMLIQVVYNMTNIFFIGKLNNADMVASIAICMPIVMVIQAFGNIFAMGGASLISRLLGEGRKEDANHAAALSFWASAILCVAASFVIFLNLDAVLRLCGASENTLEFCKTYMSIMLIGGVFVGLQMTSGGLLRAEGATTSSMIGMISGSVLNMILDPIFILVLRMDVAGAALGSVIGNAAGFCYFMFFYLRKKSIISIAPRNIALKKYYFSNIFKIGIPASLDNILMSVGMAIANVIAAGFSDDVVASTAVCMRLTSIGIMLTVGMAQGCQPLMGYNYGSGNIKRLFETIRKALLNATTICFTIAILLFIFASAWIKFFITDINVVSIGTKLVRIMVVAMPFMGIQMVLRTLFQSIGHSIAALVLTLGRQGLFFIPALFIFSALWGLNGFMCAIPFSDILTTVLAVLLMLRLRKKLQSMEVTAPSRLCPDSNQADASPLP